MRLVLPAIFTLCLGLSACQSPTTQTTTRAPSTARTTTTTAATSDSSSAPAIAQREVIRRQEMIRQMDEAALRASQRMAEDDLEGAVEGYRRAIGQ